MKKSILLLSIIGSMLFGGIVSAATTSMWGKYKGNDIIRVQYNGNTVSPKDVPAIIYNGRVMIPVTMLNNVGVAYTWDQANKTIKLESTTQTYSNYNYQPQPQQQQQSNEIKINPADLKLYSNDGKTYLGNISTNSYDSDSIFNKYGTYGSKYSLNSITNEYGVYGSAYSDESAYNEYATKPPILTYMGETIYYVTTNSSIAGGISPRKLYDLAVSLEQ